MQRKPDESFATYKVRRAAANLTVKRLNSRAKSGPIGTREQLRAHQTGGGTHGKNLMAHFARLRATPALLHTHKLYVARMAARKANRGTFVMAAAA